MAPERYCLVVEGEIGSRYASAFEGMRATSHDGITEITGPITDSAHLQGLIERITGLGLKLRSLTALEGDHPEG